MQSLSLFHGVEFLCFYFDLSFLCFLLLPILFSGTPIEPPSTPGKRVPQVGITKRDFSECFFRMFHKTSNVYGKTHIRVIKKNKIKNLKAKWDLNYYKNMFLVCNVWGITTCLFALYANTCCHCIIFRQFVSYFRISSLMHSIFWIHSLSFLK